MGDKDVAKEPPAKDKTELRKEKIKTIKDFYADNNYILPKVSNEDHYDIIYDILFEKKIPANTDDLEPIIITFIGDYYNMLANDCTNGCVAFNMTCKCNYMKSLKYYKIGADKGEPYSHYALGMHYSRYGVYESGEKHFDIASSHKIFEADTACGDMFALQGDYVKMLEKYKRAIENGKTSHIYTVGQHYYRQKDYENAVKYFMMGVMNNCPNSRDQLINYYLDKSGFDLYNDLTALIKINSKVDVKDIIIILLKRDTNTFSKFIADYMDKTKLIDEHIKVESVEEANISFSI